MAQHASGIVDINARLHNLSQLLQKVGLSDCNNGHNAMWSQINAAMLLQLKDSIPQPLEWWMVKFVQHWPKPLPVLRSVDVQAH